MSEREQVQMKCKTRGCTRGGPGVLREGYCQEHYQASRLSAAVQDSDYVCTYECQCGDCPPSPQAEPSERAGIKIRTVAWQDAVAGLEGIFADLQSPDRFHDQWDWMKAGFYLDILKSEIEESQPSKLTQSSPQAQGFMQVWKDAPCEWQFSGIAEIPQLVSDEDTRFIKNGMPPASSMAKALTELQQRREADRQRSRKVSDDKG